MRKLITTTLLALIICGQIASAEIRDEYWFFAIGSWWNPMAMELTDDNIDTWWNPPPESAFNMFDDFKLDWARMDIHAAGLRVWDDVDIDGDPDLSEANLEYIARMEYTGARVSLTDQAFGVRIRPFSMIAYEESEPGEMCYPEGIRDNEGVSSFPKEYGPDGEHQYIHPFKQLGYPPDPPEEGYLQYFDEYPRYQTDDYDPNPLTGHDVINRDSFIYNTVTDYDSQHHDLVNPYDFYCDDLPENLYYFDVGHEVTQPHFSSHKEGFKYGREEFHLKEESGEIYTPRFVSLVCDNTANEAWLPWWVRKLISPTNPKAYRFKEFDFANVPDGINNSIHWYLSWVNDDVLYSRTTYPWRDYIPACSKEVYIGADKSKKWFFRGQHENDWLYYDYTSKGFPIIQGQLDHIREAARFYQVPGWCIAHAGEDGGTERRCPTPRELRSQVNMFLTYGMKGVIYYLLFSIQPNMTDRSEVLNGLTYTDIYVDEYDEEQYGPLHGQPRTDDYTVTIGVGDDFNYEDYDDPDYIFELSYPNLIDEVIDVNTKLDEVRHSIYTLDNHASVWLGEEESPLPAHRIADYGHNRVSAVPTNDYNDPGGADHGDFIVGWDDEEEEWIHYNSIDVGSFSDYDGVPFFAVSDRYNNWVPDDYPYGTGTYDDPTEKDRVGLYAPGNKILCTYADAPATSALSYDEIIHRFGFDTSFGHALYDFKLANADGRIFEVTPNVVDNWSFESGALYPDDWEQSLSFSPDDTQARIGVKSIKATPAPLTDVSITSDVEPDIYYDLFHGSIYRLGGYIKADGGYDGEAYLKITYYLGNDEIGHIDTPAVTGDTDWAPGEWVWTETIIDPGEADSFGTWGKAKIELIVGSSQSGNVWFDNVCFEDANRIYNGSFKFEDEYNPVLDILDWETLPDGGSTVEAITSGAALFDYRSAAVHPAETLTTWFENTERIYVNPHSEYTMTYWVSPHIDSTPPVLVTLKPYVRFFNSLDEEMYFTGTSPLYGDSYAGTSSWEEGSIRVTPDDFETVHNALPSDPDRKPVFQYPAYVKVGFEASAYGEKEQFDYFLLDGVTFRETNLIKNPSFETDRKGDGYTVDGTIEDKKTPDKWVRDDDMPQFIPPGPADQGFMDLYKMDNYRSWRADANDTYHPAVYSDTINLPAPSLIPPETYNFAGWQRTHGITGVGNGAEYKIKVYDADGSLVNSYSTGINQDNMNYVEREFSGVALPGAGGFAVIETYATGDGGVVDFDCVWLGEPMP